MSSSPHLTRSIEDTVGRVITFDNPGPEGHILTHRVVSIDEDGSLVTKGDANPTPDSSMSPASRSPARTAPGAVRRPARDLVPHRQLAPSPPSPRHPRRRGRGDGARLGA